MQGPAVPAVAAGLGDLLGPGLRQQVGGDLPARGVRDPRRGLVRRRPPRRSGSASPGSKSLLADGLPAFVHLVLVGLVVYIATWTGWLMHSSQYVEYLSDTQYTHYVSGGTDCGKNITYDNDQHWPTADQPVKHGLPGLVQGLESLWHYHRDVYVFHTHFLNGCTHTYASHAARLAAAQPPGRRRRPDRHQARHRRLRRARRTATACARCCCSARPPVWWGGVLALIFAALHVGRRARLAVRDRGGRRRVDLAAVVPLRRQTDLQLLRDHHAAVPRARPRPWPSASSSAPPASPPRDVPSASSSAAPTSCW